MTIRYYEVKIDETGSNKPGGKSSLYYSFKETFKTIKEVEEYLIERYGKLPTKKWNRVYNDDKNNDSVQVGYLRSYWNKESYDEKSYYQTDWITVKLILKEEIVHLF